VLKGGLGEEIAGTSGKEKTKDFKNGKVCYSLIDFQYVNDCQVTNDLVLNIICGNVLNIGLTSLLRLLQLFLRAVCK